MSNTKEFPFNKARRITDKEVTSARRAIEKVTGKKRQSRGRPPKQSHEKYHAVSIRLHPDVVKWAKKEAKKQGVGYQTVINETLLQEIV